MSLNITMPQHHPHHEHHKHHGHHHHDHSGDGPWFDPEAAGDVTNVTNEGDSNAYHQHSHQHINGDHKQPYTQCLALLRGISSDDLRVRVLGQLLATLKHQNMLPGLSQVLVTAMQRIDHYSNFNDEGRSY
jgi:hypothetical protein